MAYILSRGYKQGRAVMFYDLAEIDGTCARQMVPKDTVVQMCNNGEIGNAKIQMWEGKAIVRCSNKQLPLVKVDDNGTIIGTATQAVRGNNVHSVTVKAEPIKDMSANARVVGKLSNAKAKRNIDFSGYSQEHLREQRISAQSVDLSTCDTLNEVYEYIARDFGIQQLDKYRVEVGKKIKLDRKTSGVSQMELRQIKHSIATYLMNMKYDEIQEAYLKYV